jgi:hypothetical protein
VDQGPDLIVGLPKITGESFANKSGSTGDQNFLHLPHYSIPREKPDFPLKISLRWHKPCISKATNQRK